MHPIRKYILLLLLFSACPLLADEPAGGDMFEYKIMEAPPLHLGSVEIVRYEGSIVAFSGLHSGIFKLNEESGAWELEDGLETISLGGKMLADGDDLYRIREEGGQQTLFRVARVGNAFVETRIAALPVLLDEYDVSITSNKLYLIGSSGGEHTAWFLDLLGEEEGWQEINPFPRSGSSLPDLVASHGSVYLFADEHASAMLPSGEWKELSLPPNSIATSISIPCGHSHILFFEKESLELTAFHTITGKWVTYSGMPQMDEIEAVLGDGGTRFWLIGPDKCIAGAAVIPVNDDVWVNYSVIALFIVGMLYMGIRLSSKGGNTEDYFRGGGKIPWWASGLSLFATGASALSIMGMPGKSYAGSWIYMGVIYFLIVTLLPISVFLFAPIVRRLNISTANEYLEKRFNLPLRLCGAGLFTLNQFFVRLAGSMVFPAIALNSVFGLDISICILVMGIVTTCYVYLGGLQAVVWTDVLQAVIMLGSVILCAVWALGGLEMSYSSAMELLERENKLHAFDWSIDLAAPCALVFFLHTFSVAIGQVSDQNFIQRVQCTGGVKEAKKAIVTSMAVAVPINVVLFALGTILFLAFWEVPEQLSPALKNDGIFPFFAAGKLPIGVGGVVVVAILAATMSTVSSALNSCANVCAVDFYQRLTPNATDRSAVNVGHVLTGVFGALGTVAAITMATTDGFTSLWDFLIMWSGRFFGPMAGIFALGIFTRRANSVGTLTGVVSAACTVVYVQAYTHINVFIHITIGLAVCFVVGYVVSLLTGGEEKDLTGLTAFSLAKKSA